MDANLLRNIIIENPSLSFRAMSEQYGVPASALMAQHDRMHKGQSRPLQSVGEEKSETKWYVELVTVNAALDGEECKDPRYGTTNAYRRAVEIRKALEIAADWIEERIATEKDGNIIEHLRDALNNKLDSKIGNNRPK